MSILDIINADILLSQKGKDWWGFCPWHAENSPSFSVSPDKEFYHCFSCGAHGDSIDWLRKQRGMSYPDAAGAVGKDISSPPLPQSPIMNVARALLALEEEFTTFTSHWTMARAKLTQMNNCPDLSSDEAKLEIVRNCLLLLDWEQALQTLEEKIKASRDRLL